MNEYGNVLTIYETNEEQLKKVKDLLKPIVDQLIQKENTFFIGSSVEQHTQDIISSLTALDIKFTFIHIYNRDGTFISSKGIDDGTMKIVKQIISKYNPNL